MKKKYLIVGGLAVMFLGFGSAQAGFLPPNDLHLQDNINARDANLTKEDFNEILDQIIAHYGPVVESFGAKLKVERLWSSSTVNASAVQYGDNWWVRMYGGLARRSEVTKDGFAMVVCHELGHHLAGFAFYPDEDWAATEGQSDYFATQACARTIWASEAKQNESFRSLVDSFAKSKCDSAWKEQADRDLCYRGTLAGQSLANLLAALGGSTVPKFDTPSSKVVGKTSPSHPKAQCRLDTYFNGSLCSATFDNNVIPGKSHPSGQDSLDAEKEATGYSCTEVGGFTLGRRPACWYKANY